ncbi:MAG: putative subtilase-type serine protease precursor [Phycisphaerales bacterium]|nr:putative subtilase-type serine protease precursor [Phycisphaerales bacterium]
MFVLPFPKVLAEDKKPDEKKGPPSIKFAFPLGIARGSATRLTIRGLRLAEATEVRIEGAGEPIKAEIKSKGKADVSDMLPAEKVGDTKIEIELTIPDGKSGDVSLVVVTPDGSSEPHTMRAFDPADLTLEKEPNGGFRNAQEIHSPTTVQGMIGEANDVDVFRITGKRGDKIVAEVWAARLGSPLDSLLTLYDDHSVVVASNDDGDSGADSLLKVTLPADGTYYLSVVDANGRGGPLFGYLMSVRMES